MLIHFQTNFFFWQGNWGSHRRSWNISRFSATSNCSEISTTRPLRRGRALRTIGGCWKPWCVLGDLPSHSVPATFFTRKAHLKVNERINVHRHSLSLADIYNLTFKYEQTWPHTWFNFRKLENKVTPIEFTPTPVIRLAEVLFNSSCSFKDCYVSQNSFFFNPCCW